MGSSILNQAPQQWLRSLLSPQGTSALAEERALDPDLDGEGAASELGPRPTLTQALDAAQRGRADHRLQQLRGRLEDQLPSAGERGDGTPPLGTTPLGGTPPPGPLPRGAGGKGGLFAPEAKEAAQKALAEEPTPDPQQPYVAEQATIRRQLDQLGLPRTGGNRMYVNDVNAEHAAGVTRTLAGKTSLVEGAEVSTTAPAGTTLKNSGNEWLKAGAHPGGKADPSIDDFIRPAAGGLIGVVDEVGEELHSTRLAVEAQKDGKKTFVNMSWGTSPEMAASRMAARMMLAKPGTTLHREAVAALGHEPKVTAEGQGWRLDGGDLSELKAKVIYPRLKKEMDSPEFKAEMGRARGELEGEVAEARKAGIMLFQAAGNEYEAASRAGDPSLSTTVTAGIEGIFRVGATEQKGAGTADDEISVFSGDGPVTASTSGVDIPVGLRDGKAKNVEGTSLSSPIMTETAYLVSSVNPKLSVDQIEKILTDPRVARDIPGTERDGAGVVDPFAAALLARNPKLTAAQIQNIRQGLDADPTGRYQLVGTRLAR